MEGPPVHVTECGKTTKATGPHEQPPGAVSLPICPNMECKRDPDINHGLWVTCTGLAHQL